MISTGQDWGRRSTVPEDVVVCGDDAAAATVVTAGRGQPDHIAPVLLTGGDLHRTLGGRSGTSIGPGDMAAHVVCDVGEVLLDGTLHWFVAHLVIGGPWWARPTTVVANAAYRGSSNIAPRAHPGDGLLDVIESQLSVRQRFLSLRRLASGTHVPHPDIAVSRCANRQFDFAGRPRRVALDGASAGSAGRAVVRIRPSALRIYVA